MKTSGTFATTMLGALLSIGLVAAPATAADTRDPEVGTTGASPSDFHALSRLQAPGGPSPVALTDRELAGIEGGYLVKLIDKSSPKVTGASLRVAR